MIKRRVLKEVIAAMVKEVPNEEVKFLEDMAWCYEDASYKAPEENTGWNRVHDMLVKHIPVPTKEWHWKVLSIFTTRTIKELNVLFNTKYDKKE